MGNRQQARSEMFRVMTYNVHGCVGCDRRLDHARIAEVIAAQNPDIIALQELDVFRERSGRVHQAQIIAEQLNMRFHFHPAHRIQEREEYGDAILSRWDIEVRKAAELPTVDERLAFEPRGALWVSIKTDGFQMQVVNTHLGLSGNERIAQIEMLLGPAWLSHPDCGGPRIFCGDLNALPSSSICRLIRQGFHDTQRRWALRGRATFPSRFPLLCLDYIFTSSDFVCRQVRVVRTALTRIASDHLPLVADLAWAGEARG